MNSFEYLKNQVEQRLGGDRTRIAELFNDEELFIKLQDLTGTSDWYHFKPGTFDGCYLVRAFPGYQVYEQERGSMSNLRVFSELSDAATHFFNAY